MKISAFSIQHAFSVDDAIALQHVIANTGTGACLRSKVASTAPHAQAHNNTRRVATFPRPPSAFWPLRKSNLPTQPARILVCLQYFALGAGALSSVHRTTVFELKQP